MDDKLSLSLSILDSEERCFTMAKTKKEEPDPKEPEVVAGAEDADDDDEEEDDDYVPPEHDSDEDDALVKGHNANDDSEGTGPRLNNKRQRAVEDAFQTMFAGDNNGDESNMMLHDDELPLNRLGKQAKTQTQIRIQTQQMSRSIMQNKERTITNNKLTQAEYRRQWQFNILSELFGPTAALKLMQTAKAVTAQYHSKTYAPISLPKFDTTASKKSKVTVFAGQRIDASAKASAIDGAKAAKAKAVSTKSAVTGKPLQDPSAVPAASTAGAAAPPGAPGGGLDSLLEHLSGPTKLSTVAKTSNDWEMFKQNQSDDFKQKLETKAQGSQAFLQRKDFLSRVDQRRFEHEKTQRDQERSSRGK
jgi:hypothetical protein